MRIKRAVGIAVVVALILGATTYHFLFGYVITEQIGKQVTLIYRKNIFKQIGANVIVHEGSAETIVVDTQLTPLASSTRSKIKSLVKTPIRKVIVTHWHPDHSGGISLFTGEAEVIAHKNVLHRLSAPQEGFGLTKPGSHHEFPPRSQDGLPNKTIENGLVVTNGATAFNIIHYPQAHTDGDLAVFFHDSQIVAIGDLIWPKSFPFVDVHNGGSVAGLESALMAIIQQSKRGYHFVPGHGDTMTLDDVMEYHKMVTETRKWTQRQLEDGKSLDQVIESGLPDNWVKWESPLVTVEVWIKMIHASK